MIPELVKATLAAYAVVGLVTIIAGGCNHHTGIGNSESDWESMKCDKAYCETKKSKKQWQIRLLKSRLQKCDRCKKNTSELEMR